MKMCKLLFLAIVVISSSLSSAASISVIEGSQLATSGNIFIDQQYFLSHMGQGLILDAQDQVIFTPLTDVLPALTPDWQFMEGIYFNINSDEAIVTHNFAQHLTNIHSQASIYIVDASSISQVPLPSAALLFFSALLSIGVRQRSRR